jgi:hypothetical protein
MLCHNKTWRNVPTQIIIYSNQSDGTVQYSEKSCLSSFLFCFAVNVMNGGPALLSQQSTILDVR